MDLVSGINVLEKCFSLPLSMIPANGEFLRQKFKNFRHIQAGVTKRRVRNVKSLALRSMRTVGLSTKLAPYQFTMSKDWQGRYDTLPDRYFRTTLSRFMRYCSKQSILPSEVDNAVLESFLEALKIESLTKNPKVLYQSVCRLWNKMAKADEDWPRTILTVKCYDIDRTYAIDADLIHPELQCANDSYLKFLEGSKLFGGLPKPFRPSSISSTKGNIHRYLSALHHSGFDVMSLRSLEGMVAFPVFKRAMEWLWERNNNKTSCSISGISWTVRCIAVKHLDCDDATAQLYKKAIESLRVHQIWLSVKNTATLKQFDDKKAVFRFLNYPDDLFEVAKKSTGQKASLLAQTAVATLILIFAPMRLKNLQELNIDKNLNWIDDRLHINIPAEKVKNNEELNFILPHEPSIMVREYIDRFRSMFRPEANPFLFPGRNGGPKDDSALRRHISNILFDRTGIHLTTHQFRHVAAKLLLDDRHGHYEVARKLLDHMSMATTYEHYAGAETQAAIDLYDRVILERKHGRSGKAEVNDDAPFLDPFNPFLKGARR